MTRLKLKLTALLTTIALITVPATDAFAGRSRYATHHHSHSGHASAHYVLGNNWQTPHHGTHRHHTRLHLIDYGRSWA